ncbi:Acetolactate synthase isozyme 3 large subunit [Pseudovibrio axinellae]|uniref:Acetolactate synthase isozyme 3 large subunit n=1 Tax=Pseudovibrio axinellae TaxID=989403 RepID=A0A165YUQ6_9HYPH|nr:thiamine pyrophosphate-binding protein [Pseudovibrio axinellae]KZL19251.1 Acetolactate synthase isozyme 3 large subunit [Pseudovibrio axinellae]SEQ44181.1 acetolactate synthase-1/2/3 large subunit [Pseudovibrio axinellae]
MRGADLIAQKLHQAGSQYAFGIPGGEVLALMDALNLAGLKFNLVKHENAGGFMAEGVWHALARQGVDAPVVLLATLGPGVTNAVNVIANAFQDRVPLIFITGCVDGADAETYTHQVMDHQQLLRPIVKASFKAAAGTLNAMMDKAISIAMSGQPGPVHIDVPISVAEGKSAERLRSPAYGIRAAQLPFGEVVEQARDLINSAERPIAIAGVDAVNACASAEIKAFCEAFQIPLLTSYKGKGLIPEAHRLSLGGAGLSPKADKRVLPLLEEADLIVLIGYDPIEMRVNWRNPWSNETPVIELTPVLRSHGMHHVSHTLAADIKPTLITLTPEESTGPLDAETDWLRDRIVPTQAALRADFAAEKSDWGPASVFHELRKTLPATTVATADSGAHRILLSQIWESVHPRTMLQSSALCTMACALPLGIGHKMAKPEDPVIVFVGDAGLEMGLGDLAVLRDMQVPFIVCVLVDESLSLIEMKQRANQHPNLGVDFSATNFPALADAYGGHGVWVDDTDTLKREAQAALKRDTFTLLACRIDRRAYDGQF